MVKNTSDLFDSSDKNISLRLKEIRKVLGLDQGEFAALSKTKQSAVSYVESGARKISAEMLLKIELAFNISWRWLARGEGKMFLNEGYTNAVADRSTSYKEGKNSDDAEYWKNKYIEANEKYISILEKNINKNNNDKSHAS